MTFTSLTYLIFLALVLTTYWLLPTLRLQNALLLCASYVFYGWWDVTFAGLMLLSSVVDFGAGLVIADARSPRMRKLWLALSVVFNLGLLGFFKYYGFFVESLVHAAQVAGISLSAPVLQVVLPVGISFYTFQSMSYTIDIYRGEIRPCRSVVDYLAYVAFFPQLVAGPIERASQLLPQFSRPRSVTPEDVTEAGRLILWGTFKKLAVADNLAVVVDACFQAPDRYTGAQLAYAVVCFAFQIYCDFSAYSDIARGSAKLFGFTLMRNFALPYFSTSVEEFWRRWHISLSTWFRDYVYVPLGGNRASRGRVAANVFVTFVLSGLWHGAAWTFVIWGALNGLAIAVRSLLQMRSPKNVQGMAMAWRMVATFAFICLGWVFFRASSFSSAWTILAKILTSMTTPREWLGFLTGPRVALPLLVSFIAIEWWTRHRASVLEGLSFPRPVRWAVYTAVFWAAMILGVGTSTPFIYFQF